MKFKVIIFFLILVFCSGNSFAAFPVNPAIAQNMVVGENNQVINNENLLSAGDTIFRKTSYRSQYHKPYHNREKEAKLALTFGVLGLLVLPLFGIPALILGIMSADKRNKYYGRAKWGIILGAYSTLQIILIVTLIVALAI